MVETKHTQEEVPSLSMAEVERLAEAVSNGDRGEDIYSANFLLLLETIAEEEDIDARRDYVKAAARALVFYAPAFFTTTAALLQLSLETLRGDVKHIAV